MLAEWAKKYRELLVVSAYAFVVRVVIAVWVRPPCSPMEDFRALSEPLRARECLTVGGDMLYFRTQAHYLAKGHLFVSPDQATSEALFAPGAAHPPLFTILLSIFDFLGIRTVQGHRIALAVVGSVGVFLIGLLAWKLARGRGRTVGTIAALVAAVYPMLWINDTQSMSESLYVPIITLTLLVTYRFWRNPTRGNAALIGLMIGLAWLTRTEAGLLYVFVVAPLLYGMRAVATPERLRMVAVMGITTVALLVPWMAFNMTRFDRPVLLTTSGGATLLACDKTFYGEGMGFYNFGCSPDPDPAIISNEAAWDAHTRDAGVAYIKDHIGRYPLVMAARIGRIWSVYGPGDVIEHEALAEQRGWLTARLGFFTYLLLIPFAIRGGILLRRLKIPISPLVGPFLVVSVTVAFTSAVARYRATAEPSLVVLASFAIFEVVELTRRRLRAQRAARPTEESVADLAPDERPAADLLGFKGSAPAVPRRSGAVRWAPVLAAALVVGGTGCAPTTPDPQALSPRPRPAPDEVVPLTDSECATIYRATKDLIDAYDKREAVVPADIIKSYAPKDVDPYLDDLTRSNGDLLDLGNTRFVQVRTGIGFWLSQACPQLLPKDAQL